MPRTVKVAVIGSGLAGLTAAHLLASQTHSDREVDFEVHLFEKAAMLGMDSASVSIRNGKQEWRVDVPMRSFQGGYYPHLIALYEKLGIPFRQRDFSYSFSSYSRLADKTPLQTTLIYNGTSGRKGLGIPAWMKDLHLRRPRYALLTRAFVFVLFIFSTLQFLVCYVRLLLFAVPALRSTRHNEFTFREWVEDTTPRSLVARVLRFDCVWRSFTEDVLIPLFSAVCTAPEESINAHPVEEFLDYIWLTLGTHHYVVTKGVRDAVRHLTTNIKNIHLSARIVGLESDSSDPRLVAIEYSTGSGTKIARGFHHVVFATQASRAVPLLATYAADLPAESAAKHAVMAQIQCLESFHYVRTVVVNHTDDSNTLLPSDRRDRRDLNLVAAAQPSRDALNAWSPHRVAPTHAMTTHVLEPPPGFGYDRPVFQTTNPFVDILDDRILSVATLERAVLTPASKAALRRLCVQTSRKWWQSSAEAEYAVGDLQGAGRMASGASAGIWICGSYAHVGIPLLEGCVVSARNVYQAICKTEGLLPGNASCF